MKKIHAFKILIIIHLNYLKQIEPNYRPPPPANYPKQFICLGETIPHWIFPLPYNKTDPFLYNGAGAACWSDPKLYAGPGGCDVNEKFIV